MRVRFKGILNLIFNRNSIPHELRVILCSLIFWLIAVSLWENYAAFIHVRERIFWERSISSLIPRYVFLVIENEVTICKNKLATVNQLLKLAVKTVSLKQIGIGNSERLILIQGTGIKRISAYILTIDKRICALGFGVSQIYQPYLGGLSRYIEQFSEFINNILIGSNTRFISSTILVKKLICL